MALLQSGKQSSDFLEVEVFFFGMLTLKQDPFRRVYYVGIKCAISKDTGFAKSS